MCFTFAVRELWDLFWSIYYHVQLFIYHMPGYWYIKGQIWPLTACKNLLTRQKTWFFATRRKKLNTHVPFRKPKISYINLYARYKLLV